MSIKEKHIVLLYAFETWVLTKDAERTIFSFQRKRYRKIINYEYNGLRR